VFIKLAQSIEGSQHTLSQRSNGKLATTAYFWAMRSFEYAEALKLEEQQTNQLFPRNITFINNGGILQHTLAKLHSADYVSIIFEQQKNNRKSDTVTQWITAYPIACPYVFIRSSSFLNHAS
jgi:hypothetical protein